MVGKENGKCCSRGDGNGNSKCEIKVQPHVVLHRNANMFTCRLPPIRTNRTSCTVCKYVQKHVSFRTFFFGHRVFPSLKISKNHSGIARVLAGRDSSLRSRACKERHDTPIHKVSQRDRDDAREPTLFCEPQAKACLSCFLYCVMGGGAMMSRTQCVHVAVLPNNFVCSLASRSRRRARAAAQFMVLKRTNA